jgi:hypothetical protein
MRGNSCAKTTPRSCSRVRLMKYPVTAILRLLLVLAAGCGLNPSAHKEPQFPASIPINEGLAFPASTVGAGAPKFLSGDTAEADAGPNDWVMVALNQKNDEDKYVVYGYVRKSEDAAHWSELVTYMNTPRPDELPLAFMNRQKAHLEKKCPGATLTLVKQRDSEITYESKVAKCGQLGDQDEIVRVIYGQVNLFRLSYTARSADMQATRRTDALKLLSEFQLQNKP